MVITVDDYREIRRLHLIEGMSQRQIARQLNISRNTVKKYCHGNEVPWERKEYAREANIVNDQIITFIQSCFDEDACNGTAKQKHTAKRIYDRLVDELNFTGGESTIRRAVRELRDKTKEAFVPLEFSPGEAVQVDWGQAVSFIHGVRRSVNLICARLCASCAPIVFAYERQNEESFLSAFTMTFEYFGGVPRKVFFDNAKVAVKDGFGAYAVKQSGYAALSAHYGFEAVFCNPGAGNEKGLVEGLVGWSRRNILVPLPHADSIHELNQLLLERCRAYLKHTIRGRSASVGSLFTQEAIALMPLPGYRFDAAKSRNVRVDSYSTVRFDTNNYSVPVSYCGREVSVKGYPDQIRIFYRGEKIAQHQRCYDKRQSVYELAHYLPLLEKKGRAVFNALPVRQALPSEFLDWLQRERFSHRELMGILTACAEQGWKRIWEKRDWYRGEAQTARMICDVVKVTPVDLSAYDVLCRQKAGVY